MDVPPLLPPHRPLFRAVVRAVVPEADLDEAAWQEVEALVERTLADRPPGMRRQLGILLRLVEWKSVLRHGRRCSKLSPARRDRYLRSLQDHPLQLLRAGFWGLRTLALLGYYGRASAAEAIGYAPDRRGWEAIR